LKFGDWQFLAKHKGNFLFFVSISKTYNHTIECLQELKFWLLCWKREEIRGKLNDDTKIKLKLSAGYILRNC